MLRRPTSRFARTGLAATLALALVLPTAAPGETTPVVFEASWTGSVVVGVSPGRIESVAAEIASVGGGVVRISGPGSFMVVEPPVGENPGVFAGLAACLPGVAYAEPECIVAAALTPDDPDFDLQWNLERIGAPLAWDITSGTREVRIAVVDSGVDLDHPDLIGQIDTDSDYDFVGRDAVANDGYGHGTHVAGIIAAATDNAIDVAGIASECTLIPVRVLDNRGLGDTSVMAEGIRYAADQAADIINISAGGPDDVRVLSDAVDYAVSKGCVVVAAAGNKGIAGLDFPAAYPDVLSVGAVDAGDRRAVTSQYGDQLDLVAPGVEIHSLRPVASATGIRTGVMSGTSMATPHVAAVAALLRSVNPTWTAGLIVRRLLDTAEDLGPVGKDRDYGFGLVRADLALGADTEAPSDDDFPGVPLSNASYSGVVDTVTDPVDVLSVALLGGQEIRLWLKGSADATMSLTLFDSTGTGLGDAAPVGSVTSTGTSVSFEYAVPDDAEGVYRIVIRAEEGGGQYSLAWLKGRPTDTFVSAPKTSAWGGVAYLSGSVREADSEPVVGVRVIVDARPSGSSGWTTDVARGSSNSSGGFKIPVRPTRKTTYRVRFEGAPGRLESTSRSVVITPRASLSAPVPSGAVRRGTPFTVSGTLRPQYPAGDKSVRVSLAAREGGRWVVRRTVMAENRDRDGSTRYVARLTVPSAGRWRITASISAGALHAATTSGAVYLNVP